MGLVQTPFFLLNINCEVNIKIKSEYAISNQYAAFILHNIVRSINSISCYSLEIIYITELRLVLYFKWIHFIIFFKSSSNFLQIGL